MCRGAAEPRCWLAKSQWGTWHMFEKLSHEDVSGILDELISCFGVKEEIPFHDLVSLLEEKDTEGCVQEIATRLALPIKISLSYVSKNFRSDNWEGFRTSALARTDWTGRGIEGIIAQVSIPSHLPMFGSSGLQGYPIRVRVSEGCHAHPETFVAIMAHEFSHVLLASLCHPKRDSELHTDLIPIIMGFRDVVERGRKTVKNSTSGDSTSTVTTTYGYLTDSQFDFACSYVNGILQRHQCDRNRLLEVAEQLQRKLKKAFHTLDMFRTYFAYLDRHPPKKMKMQHAQRVVQLHAQDYCGEWEGCITAIGTSVEDAAKFARPLNHFTTVALEHLKRHSEILELATDQLGQLTETISRDAKILKRYVGIFYRLQRKLWH
jgi:hypothetical protein